MNLNSNGSRLTGSRPVAAIPVPATQKTHLYFIRHGETDYNRLRIMQGRCVDVSLNRRGRAQASAVADRLAEIPLNAIYSSTLRRALETAEEIALRHPGVPMYSLRDLEEMSWGVFEGRPVAGDVERVFEEMNHRWRSGDFALSVEGGESILCVQRRALRAMQHVLEHHEGGTVVVVTHGRFLRVLLASLLDEYGLHRMHDIHHANTSVNRILYEADAFRAEILNCTAHLDEVDLFMVD
jgi:phosphoserine phosphatase